jgi:hypothetical protein
MPTLAPLPSILPPAALEDDAAPPPAVLDVDEPPDLLDEHALSASTAATPATTRPNTLLRIGGTAFRRFWMVLGESS